jgi:hypothetical protein
MIEVLQRCFSSHWYSAAWRERLATILPSLG